MENTSIDKAEAKELGERVNDHLRYKLVQLRVQKMLQILAGSTAPSKTTVLNNVRSPGWTDHARIVDSTLALWKPAPVPKTEDRRATLRLRTRLLIHTVEDTTCSFAVLHLLSSTCRR